MNIFKTISAFFLAVTVAFSVVILPSCDDEDDDDNHNQSESDYHAHIHSPDSIDKHVGDTLHIHIEFEDHNNGKVHNVGVKIYNRDSTAQVVYDEQSHVHADTSYTYMDDFILSNANGVAAHTNWTLEAKVWGHESDTDGLVTDMVKFHVLP